MRRKKGEVCKGKRCDSGVSWWLRAVGHIFTYNAVIFFFLDTSSNFLSPAFV